MTNKAIRRPGFYGLPTPSKPKAIEVEPEDNSPVEPDKAPPQAAAIISDPEPLIGAQAIADYLKMNRKSVYRLVGEVGVPIRKQKGFGVVADKRQLSVWWHNQTSSSGEA